MLRLTLRYENRVRRFSLPVGEASLGAARECDLVAPFPGISRRHATLRRLDGGVLVTDLGSKNGLVREGARLAEVLLRPRESVKIGRAKLELEEVDSSDDAVALSMPPGNTTAVRDRVDTASLTELQGEGSPAAALAAIRAVERAGGIDPTSPDEARELLELACTALEASSVWIWTASGDGAPAFTAVAGALPAEERLEALAAAGRAAADRADGSLAILPGGLATPLRSGAPSIAAAFPSPQERAAAWKQDLLDYLASKLPKPRAAARSKAEKSKSARPSADRPLVQFPEEFVRGESTAMRKLVEALATAAQSRLDVLLLGETGTGKELVARAIHQSGPTAKGPFLAVNCAAIPAELLEAQLFGVEARVATGVDPRPGLFLKAEGGCLFLDEIGDLPEALQPKLLRALQEREILPVGSTSPKKVNVRVISASNKELGEMVRQGRYRADLYYRLRGLQFHMPPLRERQEDLPLLVLAFAQRAAALYGKTIEGVSHKALEVLVAYDWPGNVRELKNEVERAVLLCADGGALESSHFAPIAWAVAHATPKAAAPPSRDSTPSAETQTAEPATRGVDSSPSTLQAQLDEIERRVILDALSKTNGNKSRAAKLLDVTRNGLAIKMKRLGI